MPVDVKICGLKTPEAVAAAVAGGAAYLGFVFFPRSPRHVEIGQAAKLMADVPAPVKKVALVVDAEDDGLQSIIEACPVDILQFHGRETPERVAEARSRFGIPVMKACPIANPEDVGKARAFEARADMLLFDAKAPEGATRPGGNALAFDWALLKDSAWGRPWLLAGGLTPDNVAEAVRASGAPGVDVSSGVESAPGVKDPTLIRSFLEAAARL